MEKVFSGFYNFFQESKEGKLGKTAQFWTSYIHFMHLYRDFTRSIRIGDLEVFISCLPKLTNIFFASSNPNYPRMGDLEVFISRLPKLTNIFFASSHSNYPRWLVKYYDSILKLNETHPEVYNEIKQGWFAIRRTQKPFSSTAIDLTLEQRINAEAATQHLGVLSITNPVSARQR